MSFNFCFILFLDKIFDIPFTKGVFMINLCSSRMSAALSTRPLISARSMSTVQNWQGVRLKIPFHNVGGITLRAVNAYPSSGTIQLPFAGLMASGFGINSLTGESTGAQVVTCKTLKVITGADATRDGQTSKTVVKIVDSAQDLFEQTSATMSAGGSFGIFSGSANASRSNVTVFNSKATNIFAAVSVVNAIEYCDDVSLKDEPKSLAEQHPKEFLNRFGDYYVQGLIRGGYYIAYISVISESREIQNKLAGSIKASFSGFGGGSGSFDAETKSYARFSSIDIKFIQQGGAGQDHGNSLGTDLDKLSEKINKFSSVVLQHPVTFAVVASPYHSLADFPRQAHNFVDLSQQRAHLEHYEIQRSQLISLRRSLQFVQESPYLFVSSPSQGQLNEWQQKLADQQNILEETARNCAVDVGNCTAIPFTLPEGFRIPDRLESSVGPEESQKLGALWQVMEGNWKGTWKRVGQSRIFEAVWTTPVPTPFPIPNNMYQETALLEIHIEGNAVRILRTNSQKTQIGPLSDAVRALRPDLARYFENHPGDCTYTGILESGGKVTGTYKCPWGPTNSWSATVS
jgi:hypothetical protein